MLNPDKHYSLLYYQMNTKYMVVIAVMAVMLIGATALATSESAFAGGHGHKKSYEKNQATSQANACGNGKLAENVFCQNIGSQVQGDENAVALDGTQQVQEDHRARRLRRKNSILNNLKTLFFILTCNPFTIRMEYFCYATIAYNILIL